MDTGDERIIELLERSLVATWVGASAGWVFGVAAIVIAVIAIVTS